MKKLTHTAFMQKHVQRINAFAACVVDDIIERQWLDVNNRGLSENDAYCIQQVIDVSDEVKGINLSGNYMQTRGIHGIVKSLEIHKIVHLNISNTGFRMNDSSFGQNILLAIMRMPGLLDLDLSHNYIGDEGMKVFHMDKWRNDIFNIRLCDVGFTDVSAIFAAGLVNEHPLQNYDISWNNLSQGAIHDFFLTLKGIKRWQDEMNVLNISNTNVTDENVNDLIDFFHNPRFPNTHVIFYPNKLSSTVVNELSFLEYLNMGKQTFEPCFYTFTNLGP